MTERELLCRALYNAAFVGEDPLFVEALFSRYYPEHVRVIELDGKPVSMLFSIPYAVVLENKVLDSRYLYGVATDEHYRGQGLARQLLLAEAAEHPVFLRPMSPSLFDYYGRVGFSPISPLCHEVGEASAPSGDERRLTKEEYLALRGGFAKTPLAVPTSDFLSLYENGGGFVACGDGALALYEEKEDKIWFKEYWGSAEFAPRLAAFLGKERFSLRRVDADGEAFGVGIGVPTDTAFLAALD